MAGFLTGAEEVLYDIVQICTMLMELFGVGVLVYTAVRSFISQRSGERPQRREVEGGKSFFRVGDGIHRTDQQEFRLRMAPLQRCGTVCLGGNMRVEDPVAGNVVAVPEHRGIDIAVKEYCDAEHRQSLFYTPAISHSFH